ncbi:MAG TPA: PKD domain-containing protein [Vicinamibacterales bacterium]|nr:PKD domain-containing protein [Vicinamibacterales bacterium]
MKPSTARSLAAVFAATLAAASCTMKSQDAPSLTGPSEFGTSVNVAVTPDVLQQDGASQAVVTVVVRDSAGRPIANLPLTAEIRVGDQVVDFGLLSQKSIVTNGDGRATLVYTAPRDVGVEALVDIAVTPIGTSAGNHVSRSARIRLVPTGIRLPPVDLVPIFSFSPSNPAQGQTVIFDAQQSTGSIAQYRWDFGDGGTATGVTTSHSFSEIGAFFVRLTLVDSAGRTAFVSQSISVGQSPAPVAEFTFSPANPMPNDDVRFNASASLPSPGRTIVSYEWDFGDGGTASGVQVTRRYTLPRTYNVTLKVTDDLGRTSVITKSVEVAVPEDDDGGQPTH